MSDEFVSETYILELIKKLFSCYEGVFSVIFDPKKLNENGIMDIKFEGVPKDNALEMWNED